VRKAKKPSVSPHQTGKRYYLNTVLNQMHAFATRIQTLSFFNPDLHDTGMKFIQRTTTSFRLKCYLLSTFKCGVK
jgi:hypothetical protein